MRKDALFTSDFQPHPYWWDATPPAAAGDRTHPPAIADNLVIGAGYTGLHAAIQTARAGRATVVVDAGPAGNGCSTRNGGHVSTSVKPDFARLAKRHGDDLARAILREGEASLKYVAKFIKEERIDCNFEICGRFTGAHTPRHFDRLARECEAGNGAFETDAFMVPRTDQPSELGTDYYHGGLVAPRHASLDPAKYHAGLLAAAHKSSVTIVPFCKARKLDRLSGGFNVQTERGQIKAKTVIVATNGYTGDLTPWLRRRIIPIGSYIIATEILPGELVNRLFPTRRMITDTRNLVYYYRTSPDRKRVLFGGRVSLTETDPRRSAPALHRDMVALFPELAPYRISHSWMGYVAFTFDTLMHAGADHGLYHAMGYCGSGVGMASYLGMRIGRQAAGLENEPTPLSRIAFPGRPYYSRNPWFLAPSVMFYRARDRLGL